MGDTLVPLRHQLALNADILALVADSVICTDEDGRILVFNPAAEQTFGYAASEVIGKAVEILLRLANALSTFVTSTTSVWEKALVATSWAKAAKFVADARMEKSSLQKQWFRVRR